MANIPSGENLASPAGTSGRSEASEDDEDVTMEADPSGRYVEARCLLVEMPSLSAVVSSKSACGMIIIVGAFMYESKTHCKCFLAK